MVFHLIPIYVGVAYLAIVSFLLYRKWRDYIPPIEETSDDGLRIDVPKNFDLKVAIPGDQNHRRSFQTNIYHRTCSCPEFKINASKFDKHAFGRLCPHLREALLQSGLVSNTPYEPLLLQRRDSKYFIHLSDEVLLGYSKDRPWVDIYARKNATDGSFDRFGYDAVEKEWSAGYQPVDSKNLEKDILRRCAA